MTGNNQKKYEKIKKQYLLYSLYLIDFKFPLLIKIILLIINYIQIYAVSLNIFFDKNFDEKYLKFKNMILNEFNNKDLQTIINYTKAAILILIKILFLFLYFFSQKQFVKTKRAPSKYQLWLLRYFLIFYDRIIIVTTISLSFSLFQKEKNNNIFTNILKWTLIFISILFYTIIMTLKKGFLTREQFLKKNGFDREILYTQIISNTFLILFLTDQFGSLDDYLQFPLVFIFYCFNLIKIIMSDLYHDIYQYMEIYFNCVGLGMIFTLFQWKKEHLGVVWYQFFTIQLVLFIGVIFYKINFNKIIDFQKLQINNYEQYQFFMNVITSIMRGNMRLNQLFFKKFNFQDQNFNHKMKLDEMKILNIENLIRMIKEENKHIKSRIYILMIELQLYFSINKQVTRSIHLLFQIEKIQCDQKICSSALKQDIIQIKYQIQSYLYQSQNNPQNIEFNIKKLLTYEKIYEKFLNLIYNFNCYFKLFLITLTNPDKQFKDVQKILLEMLKYHSQMYRYYIELNNQKELINNTIRQIYLDFLLNTFYTQQDVDRIQNQISMKKNKELFYDVQKGFKLETLNEKQFDFFIMRSIDSKFIIKKASYTIKKLLGIPHIQFIDQELYQYLSHYCHDDFQNRFDDFLQSQINASEIQYNFDLFITSSKDPKPLFTQLSLNPMIQNGILIILKLWQPIYGDFYEDSGLILIDTQQQNVLSIDNKLKKYLGNNIQLQDIDKILPNFKDPLIKKKLLQKEEIEFQSLQNCLIKGPICFQILMSYKNDIMIGFLKKKIPNQRNSQANRRQSVFSQNNVSQLSTSSLNNDLYNKMNCNLQRKKNSQFKKMYYLLLSLIFFSLLGFLFQQHFQTKKMNQNIYQKVYENQILINSLKSILEINVQTNAHFFALYSDNIWIINEQYVLQKIREQINHQILVNIPFLGKQEITKNIITVKQINQLYQQTTEDSQSHNLFDNRIIQLETFSISPNIFLQYFYYTILIAIDNNIQIPYQKIYTYIKDVISNLITFSQKQTEQLNDIVEQTIEEYYYITLFFSIWIILLLFFESLFFYFYQYQQERIIFFISIIQDQNTQKLENHLKYQQKISEQLKNKLQSNETSALDQKWQKKSYQANGEHNTQNDLKILLGNEFMSKSNVISNSNENILNQKEIQKIKSFQKQSLKKNCKPLIQRIIIFLIFLFFKILIILLNSQHVKDIKVMINYETNLNIFLFFNNISYTKALIKSDNPFAYINLLEDPIINQYYLKNKSINILDLLNPISKNKSISTSYKKKLDHYYNHMCSSDWDSLLYHQCQQNFFNIKAMSVFLKTQHTYNDYLEIIDFYSGFFQNFQYSNAILEDLQNSFQDIILQAMEHQLLFNNILQFLWSFCIILLLLFYIYKFLQNIQLYVRLKDFLFFFIQSEYGQDDPNLLQKINQYFEDLK